MPKQDRASKVSTGRNQRSGFAHHYGVSDCSASKSSFRRNSSTCLAFQSDPFIRRTIQRKIPIDNVARLRFLSSHHPLKTFQGNSNLQSLTQLSSAVADTSSTIIQQQSFEPVLNVPAFSVFLLVAVIFVSLQWRISAIGRAAEERTAALQRLRQAKAEQLCNSNNNSADTTADQVQQAVAAYEQAYWKVERLRTVIPGVARLVSPPSQSLNRQIMEENEAAAQQFLGIEMEARDDPVNNEKQLSPVLTGVLAVIALSQIALLVLFVATDPMLTSSSVGDMLDTGNILLETVVDALDGLE